MPIANELSRKRCGPCEGGMQPLSPQHVNTFLTQLPNWSLTADGQRIRREWQVIDFAAGLDFFVRVGKLAYSEGHHPDLHLVAYRQLAIELWTHAANGLTENDFVLAAKIDELPVQLKKYPA